jgi:membrane-bound lytic murein transglycosylase B
MKRGFSVLILIAVFVASPGFGVQAETVAERRERLERELSTVERQIVTQTRLVNSKRQERQSLERDVAILEGEIRQAELGIQARAVAIEQLSDQIGEKEVVISILEERLGKQQASLADLVRKSAKSEDFSLVELMLSNNSFSDFFGEVAVFEDIKESLNESLDALHEIREDTLNQKTQLEDKQQTEAEMKLIQELERDTIEVKEQEKEEILEATRGEEALYQQILNQQQQTAAQLRSALFELAGGGGGISLPQAIELAKYANSVTGVDVALILAILEQETNIGKNLGSCVFTDQRSDRPVMHPTRDEPVFMSIASTLGFDPYRQKVSCPLYQNGSRVGWGGAMGPSQFIPSTWAMYGGMVNRGGQWVYDASSDRIRAINGNSGPSNPFNNRDAFLATALLLRDNGANGTFAGDRLAALRYYAGWGGATNPANAFYGNQVMNRKAKFEGQIRILDGS